MEKISYPLKFKPVFKEKIWGGQRLKLLMDRELPPSQQIGESWEICDRGEDQSIVENGPLKGEALRQLISFFGQQLLGDHFDFNLKRFPLLFKLIDAEEDLSLQVHPDDPYAAMHGENDSGKTEMWYVLHAKKDSKIYCGLQRGVTSSSFRTSLQKNQFQDTLEVYTPKTGDFFFIPAGTVHALGKGTVVIEIQQNSDLTYRLSDWGRLNSDGKPRPLHIEEGLKVIQFSQTQAATPFRRKGLIECSYFTVIEEIYAKASTESISPERFQVWIFLEGSGSLSNQPFKRGDFILIPAHIGKVSVEIENPVRMLRCLPEGVKN